MSRRTWIIVGIVVAIPVIAVGWWLGSPLFLDTEVNEEFPVSAEAVATDDITEEEVEQELAEVAAEPDTAASDDMPEESEPVSIASGQFVDFDASHQGTGTATIYELDDGSKVLRFENFEVTNGPDLRVYLVPNSNPESSGDITGYVELGVLKGNIGDQNYDIPDDIDISEYGSVVIYCDPFSVIFSVATLN